jgi:hypothetical protein
MESDVRTDDLGKQCRVQILVGRRRSWRTLWLRSEPVWETCWYGVPTAYSRDMKGSTLVISDLNELLRYALVDPAELEWTP